MPSKHIFPWVISEKKIDSDLLLFRVDNFNPHEWEVWIKGPVGKGEWVNISNNINKQHNRRNALLGVVAGAVAGAGGMYLRTRKTSKKP